MRSEEPVPARLFRLSSLLVGGVLIFMLVDWIASDPVERVSTDWTAFDRAADRVFTGDELYRSYTEESLPWLYPPFALWLTVPLRALGFWGSFAFSVALSTVTSVLAYRIVSEAGVRSASDRAVLTGAIFSGTTISAALIGQYSGLWALSIAGAIHLWQRDRELLAGLCLAVLAIKPNLGLALPILLLWSRSWRVLQGMALGVVGMLFASIPFGISAWEGFFRNLSETADVQLRGVTFERKMITVQTALQTITDLGARSPVVIAVFLATATITGIAVLSLWTPKRLAESRLRAFGALCLFLVAANPRLYFYDGVLMILGLLAVWGTRQLWGDPRLQRVAGVCAGGLWVGSWGGIFLSLNVIVGPLCAVLLVAWAIDTWRTTSAATELETAPERAVIDDAPTVLAA